MGNEGRPTGESAPAVDSRIVRSGREPGPGAQGLRAAFSASARSITAIA